VREKYSLAWDGRYGKCLQKIILVVTHPSTSSLIGFAVCWDSQIRGFDAFSRCNSKESCYCVSYCSTLKLSVTRRLNGVYIC
jgi:hypothetical protein